MSHLNTAIIEGRLITAPEYKLDDSNRPYCTASLANHEEWTGADGVRRTRDNMLGLVAHGGQAESLKKLQAGALVTILAKLQTTEGEGPKGGRTTKTKLRVTQILFSI
jgi:single-stranded DNA-binding protein